MKSAFRYSRVLGLTVLSLLWLSDRAAACSFASEKIKIAPTFTVKVLDYRNRPLDKVEVVLSAGEKEVGRFKTDAKGELVIANLRPGDYELQPADRIPQSGPTRTILMVTNDAGAAHEVTFSWPAGYFVATRMLAGWLRAETLASGMGMVQRIERSARIQNGVFGSSDVVPIENTELQLFRLPSMTLVAHTKTDSFGYFDFPAIERGIYYMQFKSGSYEETVFLDLDPDFSDSVPRLDILIGSSIICGPAPEYYSMNGRKD